MGSAGSFGSGGGGRSITLPKWLTRLLFTRIGSSPRASLPPPTRAAEPARTPNSAGNSIARFMWRAYLRFGRGLRHRQMRYLQETADLFKKNDLTEALRKALPLGVAGKLSGNMPLPSFFLWGIRKDLSVSTRAGTSSRTVFLGDSPEEQQDIYAYLKNLYRQAFDRLDQAGRFREAAFVLAELLQDIPAAVAYLEKLGELRLAAELAEGRRASPALVVRQWFLAGERERAMAIARRTGCHWEAATLLEKTHPEQANLLRLLYAKILAEAGLYSKAVEIAWDVPMMDPRLKEYWLELAIAQGGESGARMLAKKLQACANAYESCRGIIREILSAPGSTGARVRGAFGVGMLGAAGEPGPDIRHAARQLYRVLLRDYGSCQLSLDTADVTLLQRLLVISGDSVLTADAPKASLLQQKPTEPGQNLKRRSSPLDLTESDSGSVAVFDAVPVPRGRFLAAIGEAGLLLLDSAGRRVAHFSCPAHQLVMSTGGNHTLVIGQRGDLVRVHHLDLDRRTLRDLGTVRLTCWATSYDGLTWFTARDEQVLALSLEDGGMKAHGTRCPAAGPVKSILSNGHFVSAVAREADSLIVHQLRGPNAEHFGRNVLRATPEQVKALDTLAIHQMNFQDPGNELCYVMLCHQLYEDNLFPEIELVQGDTYGIPFTKRLGVLSGAGLTPVLNDHWIVAPVATPDGVVVIILDFHKRFENSVRVRITLQGARHAECRLENHCLTISDTAGRVLQYDLAGDRMTMGTRILVT